VSSVDVSIVAIADNMNYFGSRLYVANNHIVPDDCVH
jgi:hypothetical protein